MSVSAQGEYRTGISGFYVPEKNSLHIGFTSFELYRRQLTRKTVALDLGLKFIGATTGKRGGYFAFGYLSDVLILPQKKLHPVIGLSFLGGGGAAAPDYDGWMVQTALLAQYNPGNYTSLRAGISHVYVSKGEIAGISPVVGITWKLRPSRNDTTVPDMPFVWRSIYAESGFALFGEKQLGLIGAGGCMELGRQFSGEFNMHALTNIHGGYMQCMAAAGPHLDLGVFRVAPSALLGLGGGGSIQMKGGGLYGLQAAVLYNGSRFYAGLKFRHVKAVSGLFNYNGIFLSAGRTISAGRTFSIPWDISTKAYLGAAGFGNVGARFTALQFKNLRLMGSTFWAITHGRGAYAEGLFEASFTAGAQLPFYFIASAGAGAGSGVNQSVAAVIYAAGLGYAFPWKSFPFNIEGNFWQGGNIPPWSVGLSYRINDHK